MEPYCSISPSRSTLGFDIVLDDILYDVYGEGRIDKRINRAIDKRDTPYHT